MSGLERGFLDITSQASTLRDDPPEPRSALQSFIDKLERRCVLSREDREALLGLPALDASYGINETVLRCDVAATHCAIVATGVVSRVKQLAHDVRQIVALHIPGDAVDLQSLLFTTSDHLVQAHAPTRISWVAHSDLLELATRSPIIAKALWLDTLADASVFREWTANLGQRNARERMAHLILEMAVRFEAIGDVVDNAYELPLTQSALADALGLSLVHMNKSIQALRRAGYFSMRHRTVVLHDRAGLIAFCGFDPGYLHLDGTRIKDLAG